MQSLKLVFLILLIAMISFTHSSSASAQDQQAQQTLEKALQALGGVERLRNLNSLFFKGKGSEFRSADLQGPDPSTSIKTLHEETTAAFPSQERILYEQRTGLARAFLAEGATLLTTPGNKEYFETLAAAKYTAVPDKLSRQPSSRRKSTAFTTAASRR